MRKIFLSLIVLVAACVSAQVTTDPAILQQGFVGPITFTFDPNQGDKGMVGATECYMYSCVQVDNKMKDGKPVWEYQLEDWPSKSGRTMMTKSGDKWVKTMQNIYSFYGVPTDKTITKILMLFTNGVSGDGGKSGRGPGGADIIIDVLEPGLVATISSTMAEVVSQGSSVTLTCNATSSASLELSLNGTVLKTETGMEMTYTGVVNTPGENIFHLKATAGSETAEATLTAYVAATSIKQNRPAGITNGIYYDASDATKVTLCTYAGSKTQPAKNVFVVGDFNDWTISNEYQLKQATDSAYFWIELTNLVPQKEYAYQYVVLRADDVVKRICDVYSEKVLHPDDKWEPKTVDPTLMDYPEQADGSFVTVIQTGKPAFEWSDATLNFVRPHKHNLIIYELWVYDFTPENTIRGVTNRLDYLQQLGVNAIELMPVTEFEGHKSWGYNPLLYFALDKAYGTPDMFKTFVDECHKRGIAVILDMVFNHTKGDNPMEKLYPYGPDLALNPWFNANPPHSDGKDYGEDWNHDFPPAHHMFTRSLQYWLQEYKVDGYRLDLSHGLTGPTMDAVTNLIDYYDNGVQAVSPGAYMILEHWGDGTSTLINRGMQCWTGKGLSSGYCQVAMGWLKPDMDGNTDAFNAANRDGYISYAESHDEERMQYKAKKWGAGSIPSDEAARIRRVASTVAFNVLLNGSHMLWQFEEIGYDFSIESSASDPEGTDHRVDPKPRPELYGYFRNANRVAAYTKCAQLIQLRTRIMPTVFEGNPSAINVGSGVKVRYVQWGNDVYVVANFDAADTQTVTLPNGTWYDYFAGGTQATASYSLQPGELKIFTGSQITPPEINQDLESLLPIENVISNDAPQAYKIIRNGQVLIVRGDNVYTITGARVQ